MSPEPHATTAVHLDSFKIGDIVRHPSGRMVQIVDGNPKLDYWGWRECLPTGALGAERESGYGWAP